MRRKRSDQRREARADRALEALEARVHEALRAEGLRIPRTEEEVARAEAAWASEPAALPEALARPPAPPGPTAEPAGARAWRTPRLPDPARIFDEMARAAREGKPIPPEVEEVLRRDREAAERGQGANDEDPPAGSQA
jgi:hypothetical protein